MRSCFKFIKLFPVDHGTIMQTYYSPMIRCNVTYLKNTVACKITQEYMTLETQEAFEFEIKVQSIVYDIHLKQLAC